MRTVARLLASLFTVLALLLGGAAVAHADTFVDDRADVLDTDDVVEAGNEIADASVYVVTFATDPGNLDTAVPKLGAAAGYSTQARTFDADAIVVALYPGTGRGDGLIGLYFGDNFYDELNPRTNSIINAATTDLKDGDFSDGVVAILESVRSTAGSSGGSSGTVWIVLGVIVLVIVGLIVFSRVKKSKAAKAEAKRREQLVLDNRFQAMTLTGELGQAKLLVGAIADSPAQDVLEADVNEVEATLIRRESIDTLESDPDTDAKNLAGLRAALDSVNARVALLRQDTGWQDAWNAEVTTARNQQRAVEEKIREVKLAKPQLALEVEPVDAALTQLSAQVLNGSMPIADGVQGLGLISQAIHAKATEVDGYLVQITAEREQAEAAARAAAEAQARRNGGGGMPGAGGGNGSFWGGVVGGVIGSSMNNRSRYGNRGGFGYGGGTRRSGGGGGRPSGGGGRSGGSSRGF